MLLSPSSRFVLSKSLQTIFFDINETYEIGIKKLGSDNVNSGGSVVFFPNTQSYLAGVSH